MSVENPNFDPLASVNPIPSQEKQNQTPETQEKAPVTPEQIQAEILKKFWASPDVLTIEKTKTLLANLKQEIEASPTDLALEEQAKKVYQEYLKEKINTNSLENWNLLNEITDSIDSDRLLDTKDLVEPLLDETFKEYDFLDGTSKNLLKVSIINKLLESGPGNVIESYIGSFHTFISGLQNKSPEELQAFFKSAKKEGEDAGRTNALVEMFQNTMSEYTQKFDDLQKKFTTEQITDATQKQNILSHVEWFRNPSMIQEWVGWLIIADIDMSKTQKNSDVKIDDISEYLMNSREKLFDLSKKMDLWDRSSDMMYTIMQDGLVWDGAKEFTKMLLKIPILGKILAVFLWLNPNNSSEELEQNASLFKNFTSLKWLGAKLDKDKNNVDWQAPFEKINLWKIHFNHIKNEVKEIQTITGEIKEENLPSFWKTAFSETWYKKEWDDIALKFNLSEEQKSKSELSGREMREILKTGVKNYNNSKETTENQTKEKKREEENTQRQKKVDTLTSNLSENNNSLWEINSQIQTIDSIINQEYEAIKHWNDTLNIWDIIDIEITDILKTDKNNFWELISKEIWYDDYFGIEYDQTNPYAIEKEWMPTEQKTLLNNMFQLIQEYFTENKTTWNWTLENFLISHKTEFNEFLNTKKTELEKQKETLDWNKKNIQTQLTSLKTESKRQEEENKKREILKNTTWNLSAWVEVTWIWKIVFNKEKQQLNLWENRFQISLEHKWEKKNLSEISLEANRVEFRPDAFWLSAARISNPNLWFVNKDTTINGVMEMMSKWSYEYKNWDTTLHFTKVA